MCCMHDDSRVEGSPSTLLDAYLYYHLLHIAPPNALLCTTQLTPTVPCAVFPLKGGTRVLPPFPSLVFFDVVIGMSNLL